MMDARQISEILSLYKKHGWILRRVLLSDETKKGLSAQLRDLFGDAEITSSQIDAVWFSRSSRKDREAWELRHLSESPFALVEVFADETDEKTREKTRREMENRIKTTRNLKLP